MVGISTSKGCDWFKEGREKARPMAVSKIKGYGWVYANGISKHIGKGSSFSASLVLLSSLSAPYGGNLTGGQQGNEKYSSRRASVSIPQQHIQTCIWCQETTVVK